MEVIFGPCESNSGTNHFLDIRRIRPFQCSICKLSLLEQIKGNSSLLLIIGNPGLGSECGDDSRTAARNSNLFLERNRTLVVLRSYRLARSAPGLNQLSGCFWAKRMAEVNNICDISCAKKHGISLSAMLSVKTSSESMLYALFQPAVLIHPAQLHQCNHF